jgi:hypothetical protein
VCLADTGGTKKKDVLRLGEEVEIGQFAEELLIELRLIGEVKGIQMPDHREARELDATVHRAVDLREDFKLQETIEKLLVGELGFGSVLGFLLEVCAHGMQGECLEMFADA